MIEIQKLCKKYGDSVIFENASFTFPDRGLVCVFGPSGCGKSTLLHLLAGFDSDWQGTISVHGTDLHRLDEQKLCAYRRDNVGFVFQDYHLLSGYTAVENLLLASDAAGEPRKDSLPRAVGMLQKLGMSDKTEQKIETLSGGQKQRVAIARALMNDPSVILADEPTGALDRKTSSEMMELFQKLAETRLVIVITHDKKCAEFAERIVTLRDGKLLCCKDVSEASGAAALKERKVPAVSCLKRAFRNFKAHFGRYLAIAFAVSFGALCFAVSLSSGNIMERSIADFEKKNTAYHNGFVTVGGNEKDLVSLLERDERIENVYTQYVLDGVSVAIGEKTVDIAEKYPLARAKQQMSYGVMPRRGEHEIAISPSMAAKFERNIQNLIGKTAEVRYRGKTYSLTVSGIFNAVYDDFAVSSDTEQEMFSGISDEAYSVSYDVISFRDIVSVSRDLTEQGILTQNASGEVSAFLETFRNLNRLFLSISALIFAIGLLISSVLFAKQQNGRIREIGLLSALGYPKKLIRRILFTENLLLCSVSGLVSGGLFVLTSVAGKLSGFPLLITAPQILLALGLPALLLLAVGTLLNLRLTRMEPAEALRK